MRLDQVVIVDKLSGASLILGCCRTVSQSCVNSVSDLTGKLSSVVCGLGIRLWKPFVGEELSHI